MHPINNYLIYKKFSLKASALRDEADFLVNKYPSCEPLLLDVTERPDLLDTAIQENDLVISLLPYALHPIILEHCIKNKV